MLLTFQTPADLVPASSGADSVGQIDDLATLPNTQDEKCSAFPLRCAPGVDQRWQQKYTQHLWFQFTPAQLAAWYNERNQVEDILPPEKNGMGSPPGAGSIPQA